MNKMNQKEVSETLNDAKLYLNKLHQLTQQIIKAQTQIEQTAKRSENEIEVIFNKLSSVLIKIINERRELLIKKVQKIKEESLEPLLQCNNSVSEKIQCTRKLIEQGELILNGDLNDISTFNEKTTKLGSLPEIPELKEVSFISFNYNSDLDNNLNNILCNYGEVSRMAPVQIIQLTERPGAILVEWQVVYDDEKMTDIQDFRLQQAFGNVLERNDENNMAYKDIFVGNENQYLVRDVCLSEMYSFRVCCRFEGVNNWSPWSLPQVAATSIAPFSWADNPDYVLSNENRIAKPTKDAPSPLTSNGAQFCVGYSVEFTFLEFEKFASVGLLANLDNINNMKECQDCFVLDSSGEIYVNGIKKATKLPQFVKRLKVCFICDAGREGKVRINVVACDKIVTYEWVLTSITKLYFAATLATSNSKIMVE